MSWRRRRGTLEAGRSRRSRKVKKKGQGRSRKVKKGQGRYTCRKENLEKTERRGEGGLKGKLHEIEEKRKEGVMEEIKEC